jgi:hypothetical protein
MNTAAVLTFLREEVEDCHAALDRVQTPRESEDEPMSLAQRVEALVTAYAALAMTKGAITKAKAA